MRIVFAIALLLVSCSESGAQWIQTSGPSGAFVTSFVSTDNHVFVGTKGTGVFVSTNGGIDWESSNNGIEHLYVHALGKKEGRLLAATDGGLHVSTNLGQSWINLPGPDSFIRCFATVGETLYIGSSYWGVARTTNNGSSWIGPILQRATVALAVIGTSIFAGTMSEGIHRSTNGGMSWDSLETGISDPRIVSLLAHGTDLYAGSGSLGVFRSTNYGVDWSPHSQGMPFIVTVNNLVSTDSFLVASTERKGIFRLPHNGDQWEAMNAGLDYSTVRALYYDDHLLYAGTDGGGVYLSSNNGRIWGISNSGLLASYISGIFSIGESLFVASSGGFFHSSNLGMQWISRSLGLPSWTLSSISYRSNTMFVGSSRVGRSTNFGATWSSTLASPSNVRAFHPTDQTMVAVHSNTEYSTNNGTNWHGSVGDVEGNCVVGNANKVFAGTIYGVYYSTNYGMAWQPSTLTSHSIESIAMVGTTIFAGSRSGGLFRSLDDGVTWELVNGAVFPGVDALTTIGTTVFVGATTDRIFLSTNLGNSWSEWSDGIPSVWISVLHGTPSQLYVGTRGRGVWRRPLSEIVTSVDGPSINLDRRSTGMAQNFPNPFNSLTQIHYSLSVASDVLLEIFNQLGELSAVIESGSKVAGSHVATWDASNHPSGVYFYKLRSNDHVQVKKLLLVR